MLTPEQRASIVLQQEGSMIEGAGRAGPEHASEVARLQIDGMFNALIRIDGAEEASIYAHAMADRVVGGLRTPTDWPRMLQLVAEAAAPPPAPQSRWAVVRIVKGLASLRQPSNFRWGSYLLGAVHGAILFALWSSR